MINYIWIILIFIGLFISIFTGNIRTIGEVILSTANDSWSIFFKMALLILFWGGIFNIAVESGLIKRLTKIFIKPLKILFPELKVESKALEYICSNLIANLLGLGAAATPLGLKAMEELNKLNNQNIPSKSMTTFIILNVTSLSLFPTSIISLRYFYGGNTNLSLTLLMIIGSSVATLIGIIIDFIFRLKEKKL